MVKVDKLTIRYGTVPVVSGLSFEVRSASTCALIGASAAGKSSILRAIVRAKYRHRPVDEMRRSGDIHIRTDEVIGYVPQEPNLAAWLTVRENIELALRLTIPALGHSRLSGVTELLEDLNLTTFRHRYPHQISTGTAKRVSLARALALRPKLLLLDEPFAGFDFDVRERAMNNLNHYIVSSGASLLLVTHEPYEVSRMCDAALILSGSHSTEFRRVERGASNPDGFQIEVLRELNDALLISYKSESRKDLP